MGTRKAKKLDTTVTSTPADAIAPVTKAPCLPGISDGLGVTLTKRDLKTAIGRFSTLVDHRSTMPILANVAIRADHGGITLQGTDLNCSLRVRVECKVSRTGAVSVPVKRLIDLVKSLPEGDVALYQTTKTSATLAAGAAVLSIDGANDRDTPSFPAIGEDPRWATVDGDTLKGMIAATKHAICLDETRFHLNGILIESDGTTARMVATDGHRLAKVERDLPGLQLATGRILIRKGCTEITKLVGKGESCEIAFTKSHTWVRAGSATLAVKILDAQFPPYAQVIPTDNRRIVTVDADALSAALVRAKVNATPTRGAKLSLATGKLTISSDNADTRAETTEVLDADYTGEPCAMGVNPAYLIDALAQIEGKVVLSLGEPSKKGDATLDPMLVRSLDDASMRPIMGARFLSVVMPMRIE